MVIEPVNKNKDRIVVIDDEERMCDSLAALLSGDGYDVATFCSSPEAVDQIRRRRVDLVITDIKMPEMDGIDVLNAVREVDEGVPVILMTGYASLDSALDAIAKGAYDYLLKPVEFTYLELVVKRALEKRRGDLERLSLLEELKLANMLQQRRISELNALYEAGKSIGSAANLKKLLKQIVTLASTVTESQIGSIMLLDETGEFLTIEAAIGLDPVVVEQTRLSLGSSIAGYVAMTGDPLIVEDLDADERFEQINSERYGHASLLCCPLKIKNRVIGVINMASKQDNSAFAEGDLRLLTTFASQSAVAVDDAHQFEKNRRRLVEFEILHEITAELTKLQSISDFRTTLVKKLARVFPIDYSVWLDYDDPSNRMTISRVHQESDIFDKGGDAANQSSAAPDQTVLSWGGLDEVDLGNIPEFSGLIAERLKSLSDIPKLDSAFMAIPILRYGELAHILCLGADSQKPYSDDDRSLARLVISQAALLFEKEKSLLNATQLVTMGKMISEISHDLRRPLTNIKGGLQIVHQRWPEVAESDFLEMVNDEIHRMNELVRELVDFSNPNRYQTEKCDLRSIVKRAAELVGPDLDKTQITFESEFADVAWEVIVNKNQILEVLLNLYLNSIDAMPDGGVLSVRGLIETPAHKKEDYLALRISDTGTGVKQENLSKLFDRYYTTKETGTGLGLAVVERIVSAHSGTLAVESEEGKGTTFILYFPLIESS